MSNELSVEELRRKAIRATYSVEMDDRSFFHASISRAARKRDADRLELIIWYLTTYWNSVPEPSDADFRSIVEAAIILKSRRKHDKVAQFFTVETLAEIDRFKDAIKTHNYVKNYPELINEILVRPASGPVMVHLINDRNVYHWDEIRPLVDEILSADAEALAVGVL